MSLCKWVMDLGAIKHMTSYRVAYNTYEVISQCNMRLVDDNMTKTIRMGSVVVVLEIECKTTRMHITDMLHVPNLQPNLLRVNKLISNGLKYRFIVNKCIEGGANGDMVAIA
jgi:hypothetical protein